MGKISSPTCFLFRRRRKANKNKFSFGCVCVYYGPGFFFLPRIGPLKPALFLSPRCEQTLLSRNSVTPIPKFVQVFLSVALLSRSGLLLRTQRDLSLLEYSCCCIFCGHITHTHTHSGSFVFGSLLACLLRRRKSNKLLLTTLTLLALHRTELFRRISIHCVQVWISKFTT